MRKYIDSEKLIAQIELLLKRKEPYCGHAIADGQRQALYQMKDFITSLQQEQPKFTQVPGIEQEKNKKGWINYGLLISEIGLHRSNAIDRIKETKERATEIKRNIAPHDLAILGKYLESVGAEIVLCCLQQSCMDFIFTQDEVKEIVQQEQSEVELEKDIDAFFDKWDKNSNGSIFDENGARVTIETIKGVVKHFLNARKEE